MPSIREAMARRSPADRRLIQSLAQQVTLETGASYIVVIGANGVRYSHPDPALIGKRISEPVVALDGRNHLGVDHGQPRHLREREGAFVRPREHDLQAGQQDHRRGFRRDRGHGRSTATLRRELPWLVLYFACALAIGVAASLIARAAAEAHHVRAGVGRDRRPRPGTGGDAARRPRGRDHPRPPRPGDAASTTRHAA